MVESLGGDEVRMVRLDDLAAQLNSALDRLEEVGGPLLAARTQAAKDAAEIAALRAEREQLLARVAELEEEAQALSGVADEVGTRLDTAISEIRVALAR